MAPNGDQHTQGPYQSQDYAGDRATQVHRTMQHMPDEDRSTRSEVEASIATSQAEQLAPGVRMGDDRAIGAPPNWEGMTSTELHAAATQANSPDTAESLGRAFNSGGNKLADAANRMLAAVGKLDAAWHGAAADSAKTALTPLAGSTGQAGTAAQLMGAQMSRQAAAASEVRKLPPPQEFDQQAELQLALANPDPIAGLADMKAKSDEANAVKQEQVSYLRTYTEAMSGVDAATPSFVAPTGNIAGGDGGNAGITGGGVNYQGPGGGDQGTSTGAPNAPGVGGVTDPTAGFASDGSNETGGQEVGPLPGLGTGTGTGTSGYPPGSAPPGGLPAGSPAGAPPAGAPGAGAGGFGAGFGSFGGDGRGGAGGRGGPGGPGSGGVGARAGGPGMGGGPAGEHAGGGRGAAGAGRPGAGGMGMGAGGAGARKEEDTEHERPSYLVEGDPEGTFGTDEMTAPPVIGEE